MPNYSTIYTWTKTMHNLHWNETPLHARASINQSITLPSAKRHYPGTATTDSLDNGNYDAPPPMKTFDLQVSLCTGWPATMEHKRPDSWITKRHFDCRYEICNEIAVWHPSISWPLIYFSLTLELCDFGTISSGTRHSIKTKHQGSHALHPFDGSTIGLRLIC